MGHFDFDNDGLIKMLDELEEKVPEKVDEALDKMGDYLVPKLIKNAPYDTENHKEEQKHLREVIKRTKVRRSRIDNGKYITVFVSPRGVPNAKLGKRAYANWDADKHVFKLVVAEFGSADNPARPFWRKTVDEAEEGAIKICEDIILGEVDKIAQ